MIAWSSAAIKTNIGGNFDPATGLYTAPYDGTYAFHANIYKEVGVSDGVYCEIVLGDGTRLADVNVPNTHGFHVGSGSTVIHLAQGDTVAVDCQDFEKVDSYSSWMGYLVMAD